MENKHLIDLSIKYGLNSEETSKLLTMAYQAGVTNMNSTAFLRVADYICQMKLLNMPPEELIEELRRKGLAKG